jgi:hypothetical protein
VARGLVHPRRRRKPRRRRARGHRVHHPLPPRRTRARQGEARLPPNSRGGAGRGGGSGVVRRYGALEIRRQSAREEERNGSERRGRWTEPGRGEEAKRKRGRGPVADAYRLGARRRACMTRGSGARVAATRPCWVTRKLKE